MKTLLLFCLLSSAQAFAWCDGPIEKWTRLPETRSFTGDCMITAELQLSRTLHSYPAMNDTSLEVDYWQGTYAREKLIVDGFQIDEYNCSGNLQKSYQKTWNRNETVYFTVDNPNLHDDVDTSFKANAPLTNDEAKTAWAELKSKCENADPNGTNDGIGF